MLLLENGIGSKCKMTNQNKFLYDSTISERFKFLYFSIPCLDNVHSVHVRKQNYATGCCWSTELNDNLSTRIILFTFMISFREIEKNLSMPKLDCMHCHRKLKKKKTTSSYFVTESNKRKILPEEQQRDQQITITIIQ